MIDLEGVKTNENCLILSQDGIKTQEESLWVPTTETS